MARAELTPAVSGIAGFEPTDTAIAVDGHSIKLSKQLEFRINNGATGFTLTLQTPATKDGLAIAEYTKAIGANEEWFFSFKDVDINTFKQSDGSVYIDYSDTTDGTITSWLK